MSRKFKFESNKKKEKWHLLHYAEDTITNNINLPNIHLNGNRELLLEGCKGVFEYRDDYIKLNLAKGSVILVGSNLDIASFEEETILIKGKINSFEFCV